LRVGAVWGTTVVALAEVERGTSFDVRPPSPFPVPEGSSIPDIPMRATATGWEIDPKGIVGGAVKLRGRDEDLIALLRSGGPIPIVAGDHGLLQYGTFALYFQSAQTDDAPKRTWGIERMVGFALATSVFIHLVLFGIASSLSATSAASLGIGMPLALANAEERANHYGLRSLPTAPSTESVPLLPVPTVGPFLVRKPGLFDWFPEVVPVQSSPSKPTSSGHGGSSSSNAVPGVPVGLTGWSYALGGIEPKTPVVPGTIETRGPLKPEQVRTVVFADLPALRRCYEAVLQRDAAYKGTATFAWQIETNGAVVAQAVAVAASITSEKSGNNEKFEPCITKEIARLKFPASKKPTVVERMSIRFGGER